MIATVQNTKRVITFQGKPVTVWEGLSQAGVRFHLFVLGADTMFGTTEKDKERFHTELQEAKIAAPETRELPEKIS